MPSNEEESSLEQEIDTIYERIEEIAGHLYPEILEDIKAEEDRVEDKVQASIGISGNIAWESRNEVDEVNLERRSKKFYDYYRAAEKGYIEEDDFRERYLMDFLTIYGHLPDIAEDPEPYQCTIAITYNKPKEEYQTFIKFLDEVLEELEG